MSLSEKYNYLGAVKEASKAACTQFSKRIKTKCSCEVTFQGTRHKPYSGFNIIIMGEGESTLMELSIFGKNKYVEIHPTIINDPLLATYAIESYNIYIAPLISKIFKVSLAQSKLHSISKDQQTQMIKLNDFFHKKSVEWIEFFKKYYLKQLSKEHKSYFQQFKEGYFKRNYEIKITSYGGSKKRVSQQTISFGMYEKRGILKMEKTLLFKIDFHMGGLKNLWISHVMFIHPNYEDSLISLFKTKMFPEIKKEFKEIHLKFHQEPIKKRKKFSLIT